MYYSLSTLRWRKLPCGCATSFRCRPMSCAVWTYNVSLTPRAMGGGVLCGGSHYTTIPPNWQHNTIRVSWRLCCVFGLCKRWQCYGSISPNISSRCQFLACDSIALCVAWLCYRPSVCLHTGVSYKTVEDRIMKFLPYGSPIPLVFVRQVSSRNSNGLARALASNKGGVGKVSYFLTLSVNISKTAADTSKVIND